MTSPPRRHRSDRRHLVQYRASTKHMLFAANNVLLATGGAHTRQGGAVSGEGAEAASCTGALKLFFQRKKCV